MKKEYQKIVDEELLSYESSKIMAHKIAERCEALADKPPVMLTDEEIRLALDSRIELDYVGSAEQVVLAYIAKQKQPVTRKVKVYIYQRPDGGTMVSEELISKNTHKLLDEFEREVTLP